LSPSPTVADLCGTWAIIGDLRPVSEVFPHTPASSSRCQGVTHTFAAKESVATALKWMDDRFRGVPAASVCGG